MKGNAFALLRTFLLTTFVLVLSLSIVSCGPKKVKAVDLGLSVKWASYNVGATSPEECGYYFAWGETTTKSDYSPSTCVAYGLSTSELKSRNIIDADGNLTAAYDAATANWGEGWRMPTLDEMQELIIDCTWSWTTQNGVYGYKVTGPNGNSIFLPAAGDRYGTKFDDCDLRDGRGLRGVYWSSTPRENKWGNVCYPYLYFDHDYRNCHNSSLLESGYTVRPVAE